MNEYKEAEAHISKPLPRGWARRPAYGKQYGPKYISIYQNDIAEFFNKGKETSAEKLSPAHMLHLLKQKYPGVFRLPSETENRQEVGARFQKSKKATKIAGTGNSAVPAIDNRRIVPQAVEEKITSLLRAHAMANKDIIAVLKQEFGNDIANAKGDGTLSQQQLTSKVAALRKSLQN
jgi:hypothetical protein